MLTVVRAAAWPVAARSTRNLQAESAIRHPGSDRRDACGRAAAPRDCEVRRVHAGARAQAFAAGIRTGRGSQACARGAGAGALALDEIRWAVTTDHLVPRT